MAVGKEEASKRARADLAKRLGVSESEITEAAVEEADFPDTALGASVGDEMSGQMMMRGLRIRLRAKGRDYEYRASRSQMRLFDFNGNNYRI